MDARARIKQIDAELSAYRARMEPLQDERARLEGQIAREEWPDGPFTLHYMRYGREETEEFNRPLEAVRSAISIEDYGEGSTEKITDRHGRTVYALLRVPWARVQDRYPALPADAYC